MNQNATHSHSFTYVYLFSTLHVPQGVGPDGTSHAPAAKHVHRTANSNAAMKSMNSPLQSQGKHTSCYSVSYHITRSHLISH